MKKGIINKLIFALILINIVIIFYNIKLWKQKGTQEVNLPFARPVEQKDFIYDSISPDFIKPTIDKKIIHLSKIKGNVIILRFSNFYIDDLPYLLYLEHLSKRIENYGVSLLFINNLGRHDTHAINKVITLSSPIIEDDGSLSSLFGARLYETILIGKDFKIKFKYNHPENKIIYNQIMKYTFEGTSKIIYLSYEELSNLIKKVSYINVESGRLDSLENVIKQKRTLICFFISICLGCPEMRRIQLIKETADKINKEKENIILLFGRGNQPEILKEFSERMELDKHPINIGVIQEESMLKNEYFKIFQYDVDPRLLILDEKGNIIFSERQGEESKINSSYLLRKLG